jgi:SAM-dependent methyltransferase
MALAQHLSTEVRFAQQVDNSREYLLPFIESGLPLSPGMQVLEIGCAEGGVLRPFTERGLFCMGVDLAPSRIEDANTYMAEEVAAGQATFLVQDVFAPDFVAQYAGHFDLIMLKDTIEHIPDQAQFIPHLKQLLKPTGRMFFGFPPWTMPFGGHQQICRNRFLSKLPYFHLLPNGLYRAILRWGGESEQIVQDLMEIKDTGISLHRFERIIFQSDMLIERRRHYLFNPIYRYKFGVSPREQASWISNVEVLRDLVTTAGWYLVRMK